MLYASSTDTDVLLEEDVDVSTGKPADLVVYNDDHNTFEWVMKTFEEILGHTSVQSEQLALMIHLNGKATVKSAAMAELRPKREALVDRGLSAVIEGR
ncbi:ATP-dependent Clp protease adaptor ClpS [Lewinella sp. 4G2]|uniref:ATP-dependent Clp protease adaptor ClpS n=1 Tax=Lewinella sp. 4G2 TaxID=1803372 RepID=UPI0007B490FB|nr:ATP-dependent Clp protease adaptor ClpS [Lewinella sp. 4G2]OAV44186.1 Clp protease ClpS [Lewinella sp. 4G2]